MALPKAIQDQLDAADAIQEQLKNQTAEPVPPAEPNPAPEPAPEPSPDPQPVEPQPEPQVKTPEAADPEPDWKQRAKTLEGKYNAEVPRLHGQLKDMSTQLASALEQINQLKTATPPEPQKRQELITKDDEETFGSDLIDLSRRVVREEFAQLAPHIIGELRKEFAPIREQVGEVQKKTAQTEEEKFWSSIDTAVPDWREIDSDPQWLEWLGEVDPMVGNTRQEALNSAHTAMDAARVAAIFKVWKSTFRPEQPAAPAPTSSKREELQRQVAPSKSRASSSAPAPERSWTAAEYERAFDPRLSATMSNDEISKLQADADKAYAEGRVKW